jgi:hypothetical protein
MKNMDRLYERLTPVERFKIAIAAFGRKDFAEVDRLNGSAPYRSVREQEPAYFERLRRLNLLASYISIEVRDVQKVAAVLFLMTIHHAQTRSEASDAAFEKSADECGSAIAKLKAMRTAWETFCAHVDLRPEDVDGILPKPVFGKPGLAEIVEEILGEIEPDEEILREYEVHLRDFWHSRIDLLGEHIG